MEGPSIKIAYFIDRIIAGGTELQLVEQINRLESPEFKQVLFCFYSSIEHDSLPVKCQIEILNIRSLCRLSTMIKMFYVRRILKENKINIVQTYFFDSAVFGIICAKIARIKRTISCKRDLGFWHTKFHLFFLRIINYFTNRILVNSTAVKDNVINVENANPNKIDIIRNGIDIEQYRPSIQLRQKTRKELSIQKDTVCVGIIANMSRKIKRVDLVINAARILVSKHKNIMFFIMGDGYLRSSLEKLCGTYGLTENVFFFGKNFDKVTFLSTIDIGTLTSDSEGLSNSLMEYMAVGLPVVASNIAGNRELIRDNDNGCLFAPGDAKDLAQKILFLINNKDTRIQLGNQARKSILGSDWSKKIGEIKEYYFQLLSIR